MSAFSRHFFFWMTGLSRELNYLDSESAQRAAWRVVSQRMWSRGNTWVRIGWLGAIGLTLFGSVLLEQWYIPRKPGLPQPILDVPICALLMILLTYFSVWLSRHQYQRVLREHLGELGVPTCLACGYNLTGLTANRCPECGNSRL